MVQEEMRLRLMRSTNPIRSAYIAADNRECYNCGQVGHEGMVDLVELVVDLPELVVVEEVIVEVMVEVMEWQKNKTSESSNTITHFGNFANYTQVGEGTQAQKKGTGRRIGTGIRHDGLWYINHEELGLAAVVGDVEKEINLLHCQLGHPSFGVLSKLYPDLFSRVDKHRLMCDACELGKHTRSTYVGLGLRSCEPFILIHSDVWGPCPVTSMNVPKYLWSEAVMTAAYLINRMPSKILGMKSLAELLLGNKMCVGYASSQKGYKCWDPIERRLFVSMDVTFREFEPYYKSKGDPDQFLQEFSTVMDDDSREGEIERCDTPEENADDKNGEAVVTVPIPKDWKCAKQDPRWKDAMKEELNALMKNNTWELVKLPPGKRAVGCKWVFTVKQTLEGKVDRYKARLHAKGYSQTYGIDYDETFAPVAKMGTVRALVSCAVNFGWPLYQLDVKNAFLHGDLHEEVYMDIPLGFGNSQTVEKVCKLKKSLYGLKQSPRAWFDRFRRAVCGMGYSQCNGDHMVFYKHRGAHITILAVYVDDIVIMGDDVEEIRCLKERLGRAFEVKDLGPLRYFLGIEIARSSKGIVFSQRKYILDLLTDTGMIGCCPCITPIDRNHQLCAQSGDPVDEEAYQRLVGRLIYLCHTRPDISYAVSVVSSYMHDPRTSHLDVVHMILRYLKGTPGKGLWFRKNGHLNVEGYCDADWASGMNDRRSTSGYCVFVGGNLVSWRSKKQAVVARSTAEAEYIAMALGLSEMLWMRSLLSELRVLRNDNVMLHCDNKSAINIANNPVQHDRTKHVEIDRFFIKEKIDSGMLRLEYIKSCEQLADCLTKGLGPSEIQSINM
uniref:Retrotransposon protein, putative, unclassified n=2 Tax=Oryza sativa subsp. japonica TaxID=39947 RepID=H2KW36_ORYSJ|nr:retrotransposon protein, putative, unclassified [Oryza sativa Japonica Group]